jgi:hypothetical protein
VCRQAKIQPQLTATLYPLHAPPIPWHTIGLDYLAHLLMNNGFDIASIIKVDHLTRMAPFLPCTRSITPRETTTLFLHGVYKLHGLPRLMVNDRAPKLVGCIWQALWRRLGTRLNMSYSRHPETDRLTERISTFQQLLRYFCCNDGSNWTHLLPQVKFAYNATRALEIENTLFEAKLGFSP